MPSRTIEGFSLVVLEAAYLARPVVASRVGGLPETIEDGLTGVLVPPDDADSPRRPSTAPRRSHAGGRHGRAGAPAGGAIRRRIVRVRVCGRLPVARAREPRLRRDAKRPRDRSRTSRQRGRRHHVERGTYYAMAGRPRTSGGRSSTRRHWVAGPSADREYGAPLEVVKADVMRLTSRLERAGLPRERQRSTAREGPTAPSPWAGGGRLRWSRRTTTWRTCSSGSPACSSTRPAGPAFRSRHDEQLVRPPVLCRRGALFDAAAEACGRHDRCYEIAGKQVLVRAAGAELVTRTDPALARPSAEMVPPTAPDLVVDMFDSATSGMPIGEAPWHPRTSGPWGWSKRTATSDSSPRWTCTRRRSASSTGRRRTPASG